MLKFKKYIKNYNIPFKIKYDFFLTNYSRIKYFFYQKT
jgi:hypothetical protein